ncbi:MAG: cytochrome c3 family protein [Planctomycetota bacterium]
MAALMVLLVVAHVAYALVYGWRKSSSMKRTHAHIALAVLSALGVVGLVYKDVQRTSPGGLSEVHARIEDLAGAAGCDSCHGDSETSRASACLECHDVIAGDIAQQAGLHGTFEKNVRQACNLCHSEHHGANFSMVNARTFLLAEIPMCRRSITSAWVGPLEGSAPRAELRGLSHECGRCGA